MFICRNSLGVLLWLVAAFIFVMMFLYDLKDEWYFILPYRCSVIKMISPSRRVWRCGFYFW